MIFKFSSTRLLIATTLLMLLNACKENEIYPPIPSLEWKSSYFIAEQNPLSIDTLVGVRLSYKDGDGDIGLNISDTFAPFDRQTDSLGNILNPYFYNLVIDYYEIKNGIMKPFILPDRLDTFKVQTRITSLTPDGVHKAIRGDIDYQFSPPLYPELIADSFVLRIYLYDRALHTSNVVQSPILVLP